jgi:hypothetical protein
MDQPTRLKPRRFEYEPSSDAWFYITKHGRVAVGHSSGQLAVDLVLRAEVADDATRITEQNIADMAGEEKR